MDGFSKKTKTKTKTKTSLSLTTRENLVRVQLVCVNSMERKDTWEKVRWMADGFHTQSRVLFAREKTADAFGDRSFKFLTSPYLFFRSRCFGKKKTRFDGEGATRSLSESLKSS